MMFARLRSGLTLLALAVLLLVGVSWGWSAVTEPFPEDEATAACSPVAVSAGTKVYPDQVAVSVLNAGAREGLASRTMAELDERGFSRAELSNAPADTELGGVEIWTENPGSPAVRLVLTFLGEDVRVVRRDTTALGVNIVVGDNFEKVVEGRKWVKAADDVQICSPPEGE
ncbi:MAG: LytR C-terminal domain-containing protein [Nocardioides sp.]